jgi:hypothetical protein
LRGVQACINIAAAAPYVLNVAAAYTYIVLGGISDACFVVINLLQQSVILCFALPELVHKDCMP